MLRFFYALFFCFILLHAPFASACIVAVTVPTSVANLETAQQAQEPEVVFIGVVVFYTSHFKSDSGPFSGATPVLKVIKNIRNSQEDTLIKGLAGSDCTGYALADLGDVVIYRSGFGKKAPDQLLLDPSDPAIYEYLKKHFDLDIRNVDKTSPFFTRVTFQLRETISALDESNAWLYLWCGGVAIAYFISLRKRRMKNKA